MLPENENMTVRTKSNDTWKNTTINNNNSKTVNSNNNTPQFISNVENSSKIVSEKYEHVVETANGISWIYYYSFLGLGFVVIFLLIIWWSGQHLKWLWTKQKRPFNWDEERRMGGLVLQPSEVVFNPMVFDESALPLHLTSPVRKQGFRMILTENARRYVSRFSGETRKRSFEKEHDPEKSISTSIDLS